jgi:hypothetical protein
VLRIILGGISIIVTGCFGRMLFGKLKQSVFMQKMLGDAKRLANFINALDLKNIATASERLVKKGDSFRNNLEDVVAINSIALKITKFQYLFFTVAGIVGGLFIHRHVFWADLAILAIVANLKMPRLMAEIGAKDIRQMVAIMYRLRQEEPIECIRLMAEIPAFKRLEEAIIKAEKTSTKTNAESENIGHTSAVAKEG